MTRKNNSKFLTIKPLLVCILAILMCLSLFMAVACTSDDESSVTIPEYSYVDNDDGEIKNPSFTFGTQTMEYDDYPKTSVDGWNFSKVATSKSGVVDVSNTGWTELMSTLYKDEGILKYVKHINNFDDNKIRDIIKNGDESKTVSSDEIKQFIIDNYFLKPDTQNPNITDPITYAFLNPQTHASDLDNKVYMLNNYVSGDFDFGCIQTITSSSDITLKRGEYAKISAWVKTVNLNTANTINNYGKPIGANITVKNSFNGSNQSNYGIYNIVTEQDSTLWQNNGWEQFTFYVKADDVFETKFSLQLSLGYDEYSVEGTAFFDDITVKLLTADEYAAEKGTKTQYFSYISYNDKNAKPIVEASTYDSDNLYLYDMTVNIADIMNPTDSSNYSNIVNFHNDKTNTNYYDFTKYYKYSPDGSTVEYLKNGNFTNATNAVALTHKSDLDAPYGLSSGLEVKLNAPSSYTITIGSADSPFVLNCESYSAITFFVKNTLNKLYSPSITINVYDIYEKDNSGQVVQEIEKRKAVATISETSDEWSKYTIVVRNNFDEDATDSLGNLKYGPRKFYFELILGPVDYTDVIDNYALGTVTLSSFIFSTGKTYQYTDDTNEVETDNYQYYKLLSNTATGDAIALYAGFDSDYEADETDSESYSLITSASNIGQIIDNPTTAKFYTGIEAGHYYITGDENDSVKINNNAYAGLINSQYISNYKTNPYLNDIDTALNHTDTENNVQPLMIKTNGKAYGFISDNYTVSVNSYAKVSVKVRVYNATAYIYLVDTSKTEKQVLKLDTFTVNSDKGLFDNQGQSFSKELFLTIDDSTIVDDNGWATVEFYVATGATEKTFRVELWNGARDNTDALTTNGYIFFNDIDITTSGAFEEPSRWQDAFDEETPLYNKNIYSFEDDTDLLVYQRVLTDLEKQYNSENGNVISYQPNYVWAKTSKMIYAIYNTIDPTEVDPYATDVEDETTESESLYESDPAAFWLSLSSIIIGVALIIAIIMLFIKNIRRRRKANRNDAKSHYTVRSRTRKPSNKVEVEEVDINIDDIDINIDEPSSDEAENGEQTLDSYVYGDVQDFGEQDKKDNE